MTGDVVGLFQAAFPETAGYQRTDAHPGTEADSHGEYLVRKDDWKSGDGFMPEFSHPERIHHIVQAGVMVAAMPGRLSLTSKGAKGALPRRSVCFCKILSGVC